MKKWFILIWIVILSDCRKNDFTNQNQLSPIDIGSLKALSINTLMPDSSLMDKNIRYFGRWYTSNISQCSSYWGGAYFRINFTGHTVKIKVDTTIKTNYFVKIDTGKWISYIGQSGLIDLTPIPLTDSVHTLSVAQGKDYSYVFNFQGLILDSLATTFTPRFSKNLIEYIGDSITTGYFNPQANVSNFAWLCSESLNAEHTQIAYPGICLANGHPGPGMLTEYLKQQSPAYLSSPNWDFSKYTPNIVVSNLGVNDQNKKVSDATFKTDYILLLKIVRAKFPNAQIFVLRTFTGVKATPTLAAVNARLAASDRKVHYVNTGGWLTNADYSDGIHPTLNGQIKIATRLKKILSPYMLK